MPYELRVLIDGRALVGPRSGIGVHTAEIARRLDVTPPPLIASHAEITNKQGLESCRFRVDRAPNGILWQQLILPRIGDGDVLWAPHGTIPITEKIPAVVTLHDFSSITMPGHHLLRTIVSFDLFITRSLDRARRIAAVSRTIAEEAVRWFGVRRSAIEIVPNGVDEFFTPDESHGDYILFVGTLEPRKGIGDLPAIDSDSHPRAAAASRSVISRALRSHRNCLARSAPRHRSSRRSGSSRSSRRIAARKPSTSPGSTSSAAPSAYSAIAPVRVAITGAPQAIASSGGIPNPS